MSFEARSLVSATSALLTLAGLLGACAHPPDSTVPAGSSAPSYASATSAAPTANSVPGEAAGTQPASNEPPGASAKPGAPGAMCGGIAGFRCGDGLFCDFPLEAHCGAADQTGTCQPTPGACTRIYKPVCGCDDHTYPTECVAHASGVSVAHEGECKESSNKL